MVRHFEEIHKKIKGDVDAEALSISTGTIATVILGTATASQLTATTGTIAAGRICNVTAGTITADSTQSDITLQYSGSSSAGQAMTSLETASGTTAGGWIKAKVGGVTRYLMLYTGTVSG